MKILISTLLFVITLLIPSNIIAQGAASAELPSEKEKARKESEKLVIEMVDQAVGDVGNLRLAQNRATVYALAGDLYWNFDETRARKFFRSAADEIIINNNEAEKEKRENEDPYTTVFDVSDIRIDILPIIAARDADLALQLLVQTRSPQLAQAMAKAAAPTAKQGVEFGGFDSDRFRVQNEIALEQRFALLAAEQNPDRAIKLIKESLAKGISWNVMPILQKLYSKDAKKAAELAGIIVQKVVETDLTRKRDDLRAVIGFLQNATNPNIAREAREKRFAFTDSQLNDLANKIAATLMQPGNSIEMASSMSMAMPSLEKLLPEKALLLKQRQAEMSTDMPPELRQIQSQQKVWSQDSTPEEILLELPKLNDLMRANAYGSLAGKISQIQDDDRAKRLIEQIPDEKWRERASDQYESAKIGRIAAAGKLDEARKLIGNLTKKRTQIQKLVSLAIAFKKKETEKDTETALGLMRDAKGLANENPEDEDELNDLMEVVRGYAVVDPAEGFRLFDPIVDQINDFIQASAILSKYNKRNRSFRKGELVMKVSGYTQDVLLFRYISQIQLLAKADLNRMSLLSDRFQRADTRTVSKLLIAQGFMKDEKAPESSTAGGFTYIQY